MDDHKIYVINDDIKCLVTPVYIEFTTNNNTVIHILRSDWTENAFISHSRYVHHINYYNYEQYIVIGETTILSDECIIGELMSYRTYDDFILLLEQECYTLEEHEASNTNGISIILLILVVYTLVLCFFTQ